MSWYSGRRLALAIACFGFALVGPFASSADAARVTPMIVELKPSGRDAVGRVTLTNDSDRDIPYEVQMMRGDISPDGELKLTPADEQFVVFPPQAVVEKRSQQVFRIQYAGEEALDRSQIYYLAVKQVPIAFKEGQNQVQVVINYNVLVNVVPDSTSPVPVVRSATYVERAKPMDAVAPEDRPEEPVMEHGLQVDLANDGSRYFFAGQSKWTVTGLTLAGAPFERILTGEEMSKLIGVGVVGAGKNRLFFIPLDPPLKPSSIKITVDP